MLHNNNDVLQLPHKDVSYSWWCIQVMPHANTKHYVMVIV